MILEITNDILLKPITLDSAPLIFNALDADREYLRIWLPFVDTTEKVEDTMEFVQSVLDEGKIQFCIYYRGQFAGIVGLNHMDVYNKKAEIGYWISPRYEGKGIITQSVKELLIYAFSELELNKILIKAGTENHKSRKVAERLNFTLEGIERDGELLVEDKFTDLAQYGLLKKEFTI